MTDTQELRRLAEAAKGWLIRPSIVQETADDILKLGSTSEDGEFYELIEIDCENYDQPSRPLAEYIAAANPAAILSLLDRLEKAEKDAECFLLWVHEAWHSPSDIMKLLNNCETPEDYRAKLLPIIAAKKAAITGAMEASK